MRRGEPLRLTLEGVVWTERVRDDVVRRPQQPEPVRLQERAPQALHVAQDAAVEPVQVAAVRVVCGPTRHLREVLVVDAEDENAGPRVHALGRAAERVQVTGRACTAPHRAMISYGSWAGNESDPEGPR
jgi:hypothetical protein